MAETKLAELAAAQITQTTEFIYSPVPKDAVVVLLDGMHEPIMWKMLAKEKHEGGEMVVYFAAKQRIGRAQAINWRNATTMPEFSWDSGEEVKQPLGVYAVKVQTSRILEAFGQNVGSEHQRRITAALRDMYLTIEKDIFLGSHNPANNSYSFDGLNALIPSDNVISAGQALDRSDVIAAARAVASHGGQPRYIVGSPSDLDAVLQAFGVVQPTPFLSPEDWQKWWQMKVSIPTPYGVLQAIPHPLLPSTGTRSIYVLDPDTPTPEGPSLHIRYAIDEDPSKVEVPQGDLAIAVGFLWIGALVAPGRYWQARIVVS